MITTGRRRIGVLLALAVALACVCVGLAGCANSGGSSNTGDSSTVKASSSAQSAPGNASGTLRVGVRSDIVGFGLLNEKTGKYYGLEVDIAEEMAARMGYSHVEYRTVTPETRKQMLLDGEVDAIVACYSIADSRLENFDFSPAYYEDQSIVMVENSSLFTTIDQLKGKRFGTIEGSNTGPQLVSRLTEEGFTSGEALMQTEDHAFSVFDTFELIQLESYEEVSRCLEEGAIDAACMDGSIAKTFLDENRSLLDFVIATQEYGVATQKDSELSSRVAEAIQGMLDDGTIAYMIDVWN